jgi:hypothetical protein
MSNLYNERRSGRMRDQSQGVHEEKQPAVGSDQRSGRVTERVPVRTTISIPRQELRIVQENGRLTLKKEVA